MSPAPITLDLFDSKAIVDDDVSVVVRAFVADPARAIFTIGEGWVVDVAAAVAAHPFAASVMHASWTGTDLRRAAVRAAVLLARPVKACGRA